jgi:hypothetical protein
MHHSKFLSGYPRFHFYWVDLLWPFLFIAIVHYIKNRYLKGLLIALTCVYIVLNFGKLFDHATIFKMGNNFVWMECSAYRMH